MTIKGVYEDIPENSSLYHEVVISFSTIEKHHWECMGWECGDSFQGYIRLKMPLIWIKSTRVSIL